jgi:hypothetical protein
MNEVTADIDLSEGPPVLQISFEETQSSLGVSTFSPWFGLFLAANITYAASW